MENARTQREITVCNLLAFIYYSSLVPHRSSSQVISNVLWQHTFISSVFVNIVFITFSPHIIDIVSLKQLFLIRTLQYWLFYLNYIPSNLEFSLSPFAHSKSDIPSKNITKPVLSTCNIPANQALLFHLKLTDYDNSCFTNLHHINHSHKSIYH